ncbi:hypothetical protein U1Q18_013933 [Sarracenia purpurea var. burkii]
MSDSGEKRKFFSILGEKKSQAAATGGTSPAISVQRARKIEIQLRRSSELQDWNFFWNSSKGANQRDAQGRPSAVEESNTEKLANHWRKIWCAEIAARGRQKPAHSSHSGLSGVKFGVARGIGILKD